MKSSWIAVVVIGCVLKLVACANILTIFPSNARSHLYAFQPLFVELAKRGHNVVVVSHFPLKPSVTNYTDITLKFGDDVKEESFTLDMLVSPLLNSNYGMVYFLLVQMFQLDKIVLKQTIEKLNDSFKFDLLMLEVFNTDLFFGLAHKYKTPVIALSSSYFLAWASDRFAVPDNPSYIPTTKTESSKMSFRQRIINTYMLLWLKHMYAGHTKELDEVVKQYIADGAPPLEEYVKETSLVFVNTHYSMHQPRPLPPQAIEVAGLHIKPAQALPQDLEQFINESTHGVIYFSFGSLVHASTMSKEILKAFCEVFSKLPQRVLWKWEADEMPNKPDNVKIIKWAPQRDILAHPNIKLFISHGGNLGTIEAVHSGVPILGMPFYGDQMQNIENLVDREVAIRLNYLDVTTESLSIAVNKLLEDPKYQQNARKLSQIFRDRPQTPLETAVFWTEYVLRHKGAHHLRTAAVHLPWYQYLLLDVIAALLGVVVVFVLVLFYSLRFLYRRIFTGKEKKVKRQ